jgi:hypothetical protein
MVSRRGATLSNGQPARGSWRPVRQVEAEESDQSDETAIQYAEANDENYDPAENYYDDNHYVLEQASYYDSQEPYLN